MKNFEARIARARALLAGADALLIGGGAGLSAAAELTYAGERFQTNFPDFIAKYGMQDMYSAGFYPFPTQEEKWAYWSRHIFLNRISPPALPLYRKLFSLVQGKDYFVITTNVDAQFEKAGFEKERISIWRARREEDFLLAGVKEDGTLAVQASITFREEDGGHA